MKQVNQRKEPPDPRKLLKDPASLLNNTEGLMQNPVELLKGIEMPENPIQNPLQFFKLEEAKLPADSSKVEKPDENPPLKEEEK